MRVMVSSEHRFVRGPDGAIATAAAGDYGFWCRYLDCFDEVRVLARVEDVAAVPAGWHPVEGNGVRVEPVTFYLGPSQYLRRMRQVRGAAIRAAGAPDAVIMRVASPVASTLVADFRRQGRPFGLEVVGDPHDAFGRGAIHHPFRPLFRRWLVRELRAQCASAAAVAYVTAGALQRRYPASPAAFVTAYSSISLQDSAVRESPRPAPVGNEVRLVTVGSLANMHKGVDTLLDAMASCLAGGLNLHLEVVGDGLYRPSLERHAERLGISARVSWLGQLPAGEAVVAALDRADLFVLASRTEGLARAMIEAMARGLPCIGTTAGGTPELLSSEFLVPPADARALAERIATLVADRPAMAAASKRNLARAADYREILIRPRRTAFYEFVRQRTREWRPQ